MSSRSRSPRPPVRWRPRPAKVAAVAATAFVGIFGLLGARVATGDDPVLGSGTTTNQVHSVSAVTSVSSDDDASSDSSSSSSSSSSSQQSAQNPSTGTSGG